MEVVLYNSESEMPYYLRKEKSDLWNTLDQAEWDDWNFVPTDYPQKSLFHQCNTWKSHRHDYFNRAQVLRETQEATSKRIANKMSSVASYAKEVKEAKEEERKWEAEEIAEQEASKVKEAEEARKFKEAEEAALKELQEKLNFTNTILPQPEEYIPFKKQTTEERAKQKSMSNKKYYAKSKKQSKKTKEDPVFEFCNICGGEHKATPSGRSNHNVSYQHTSKLMRLHAAGGIMNNKNHINTIEQGEAYIDNLIKNDEDNLCRKLTKAEVKNKYRRLAAQYTT
tara:strand:+ start:223 stop:1068 length:846 start_codon:yes stop_codon:yes gene_type:complete